MPNRLKELFERFLDRNISPDEEKELMGMALESGLQDELRQVINDAWQHTGEDEDITDVKAGELMQRIFSENPESDNKLVPIHKRTRWRSIAAAAAIVIAIGAGAYYAITHKPGKPAETVIVPEPPEDIKSPQTNRATITMAGGKTVYLDSAVNGTLAVQGKMQVIRLDDGQIAYRGSAKELIYNTLTNPRGSKVINMTLSDGSQVWLNAGSSVTYPVAFIGNERKVSVTGEAYFEVAHDVTKPFIVSKGDLQVQVLGTRFNINAYDDENDTRITLLQGSVKVNNGKKESMLQPGQQAQVTSAIKIISNTDVDQVMAWKNGLFVFDRAGIQDVMRQLARWYDLDVHYAGDVPKGKFKGEISRDLSLSQVLNGLTATRIHFIMESGNRITILPE
ncbi:MAG: FecR domain-containing protein [Chitinophagaceae bacterium]|nr:FecR domain-containing protein [Chitinophagaceae bacterium]